MEEGRGSSGYRRHHRTRSDELRRWRLRRWRWRRRQRRHAHARRHLRARRRSTPPGAEWGNRSPYYQAVFDTLLLATPEGTIEPWLATEWSYNEDNTVLTLTLRDDVTFTDGSQLTGDVVVKNLQRFKDGTSPDAGYFAGVASFEAPDDTTVVITLSAPDPAMLNYLTRDPGLVGAEASLDSADVATTPIGSGPYILDTAATVTGTTYAYTKNPDYWNPDVQHYDNLVINVLADPTAALNAIKAGEANGVKLATNDALDRGRGRRLDGQRQRARLPGPAAARPRRHDGPRARRRQGAPGDQLRVRPRGTADRAPVRPRHGDHPGVPRVVGRLRPELWTSTTRTTPRRRRNCSPRRATPTASRISMPTVVGSGRDDLHADRAAARRGRDHRRARRTCRSATSSPTCWRRSTRRRSWRSSRTPTGS